jgi:hypothetical protein
MAERDLTDEEFVDLAVALVRTMFDPEPPDPPERQRLARVHGRLRPTEPGLVGKPSPRRLRPVDGPPDPG